MSDQIKLAAKDVSDALLEITGEALMSGNFEAFLSVFHVPQYMATLSGPIYMETEDDMRRAFDSMHAFFTSSGVTELAREVTESRFVAPDRIESTHIASTLRNGEIVTGPYPVFSTIEKIDGTWKVTGSEYALEADSGQAAALAKADVAARESGNMSGHEG